MKPDRATAWFLAIVFASGIVYAGLEWTPSSYGYVLADIFKTGDPGPIAGVPRTIRSDEWAVSTPYFQAAVRNRFRRFNQTSFYHEDLRTFYALPLADWSLLFKPQLWAFFITRPARAFSIYYAFTICSFLAGYYFFFKTLGVPPWISASSAYLIYFCGFTQFWWTTYGPLLAGLPWVLFLILQPMAPWRKAICLTWVCSSVALSHMYLPLIISFAWGALLLLLATRPTLIRSRGQMIAITTAALISTVIIYSYFAAVIPIMRNTIYPGQRHGASGTTPFGVVLSQWLPFLTFRIRDYQHLIGENICEIGTAGTFLPVSTLCLTRYRALRQDLKTRRAIVVLLSGFLLTTLWEIAPIPPWIGRLLLWDTGAAERWLFISGFLLLTTCLIIWSRGLISLHPGRIALFVALGPVTSLILKMLWLSHKGEPLGLLFGDVGDDAIICALGIAGLLSTWYFPPAFRSIIVFGAVVAMNIYGFWWFNPLQPAEPIFAKPNSMVFEELQRRAAAAPNGILVEEGFPGAILNGAGFRSVSHVLLAPRLDVFRQFFPNMPAGRFNFLFNRYAHIVLSREPLPDLVRQDVVKLPEEVFLPIRNVRPVTISPRRTNTCSIPMAGGITQTFAVNGRLTIEGWAPWSSETEEQQIEIIGGRPNWSAAATTVIRPDIAEALGDYNFVKAGFRLQISAGDIPPLNGQDVILLAHGTIHGETRLTACSQIP